MKIMIYELQFNVNNYGVGELRTVRRFPNKRRFAFINLQILTALSNSCLFS